MIIDSSAICAILFREPEARRFAEAIRDADVCRMSAESLLETAMVIEGRAGLSGGDELDAFIERHAIEIVPVTPEHVAVARRAWRRFGKGNHPAALNLGDCLAYALSQITREPLLFKGDDFTQTDIQAG